MNISLEAIVLLSAYTAGDGLEAGIGRCRLAALSDTTLIRAVAAGDHDAFAVLYRRHLQSITAFFRGRVRNAELVADLTAETFATVALCADAFRGEATVAAWIFGIARNNLLMSLRRGRVENDARGRLAAEPFMHSDEELLRVEERAEAGAHPFASLLADLPDTTRRAVLARVVDEREYRDIAEELEISQQVVRQRVHRGLDRLRVQLRED